jgi:hypothetical protein
MLGGRGRRSETRNQFDEATDFTEGLAAVRLGDYTTGKCGYIDKQGKFVITPQFGDAR